MSPEFALSLTDIRLTQTARLLESMGTDSDREPAAVTTALQAVNAAHRIIRDLQADPAAALSH